MIIYSKLHSKSCDYLYKFSSLHCFGQKLWTCNGAQANYRRMDAESFNLNLVKQKWNKMEIMNLGSPHLEQVLQYNWIPSYVSSAVVTSSIWRKNRTDPALHRCSFPMLSSHNTSYVTDLKSRKTVWPQSHVLMCRLKNNVVWISERTLSFPPCWF